MTPRKPLEFGLHGWVCLGIGMAMMLLSMSLAAAPAAAWIRQNLGQVRFPQGLPGAVLYGLIAFFPVISLAVLQTWLTWKGRAWRPQTYLPALLFTEFCFVWAMIVGQLARAGAIFVPGMPIPGMR